MVVVAPAHALVLTVSHDSPIANPFIVADCRRRASPNKSTLCRTSNTQHQRSGPFKQEQYGALAAMSDSVSRSSNPLTAAYRGVAHLFLTGMSALPADQRRTDEASRPDWANYLPGHPASFVRFVRTVGSPQSCSGARNRRSVISGRFLAET
jgi:hypothetical protein